MLSYHEEFCAMLCNLITSAWLPEDQWMVPSGKWVRPRTVGLAANAFFDSIGSSKKVNIERTIVPKPHDSLLNRAKRANRKRGMSGRMLWALTGAKRRANEEKQFPSILQGGANMEQEIAEMEKGAAVIQRGVRARQKQVKLVKQMTQSVVNTGAAM